MTSKHAKKLVATMLTLVMAMSLTACSKQAKADDTTGTQTSKTEQKTIKKINVKELYSEDGTSVPKDGPEMNYAYHVPQIDDATPDAAAINKEIADVYGRVARENLQNLKNKEPIYCRTINYDVYYSGNVMSIVVHYIRAFESGTYSDTFLYDMTAGKKLTNSDIWASKGISQEQYLHGVRRAAAKCFDDQNCANWFAMDELPATYHEIKGRTLSAKNINADSPLFLDNQGNIHALVNIGSIVGSDWISKVLPVELAPQNAPVETNKTFDFLTATRRGDKLTLRLHETDWGIGVGVNKANGSILVDFDKDYKVHGLYGNYTKMHCTLQTPTCELFIFLLTKEGRVEYVDVTSGLKGGYFCASGPLAGVEGVQDFLEVGAENNDGPTVYAVYKNGKKVDLRKLVEADQTSFHNNLSVTSTNKAENKQIMLILSADASVDINYEQNYAMPMRGTLKYLGMTEQGEIYYHNLSGAFSRGGAEYIGISALEFENTYNEKEELFKVYITELSGEPLVGDKVGDKNVFVQRLSPRG